MPHFPRITRTSWQRKLSKQWMIGTRVGFGLAHQSLKATHILVVEFSSERQVIHRKKRRHMFSQQYVSLEVELLGWSEEGPRLIIKQWVNGLVFFDKCSPINVVFPWPKSLV